MKERPLLLCLALYCLSATGCAKQQHLGPWIHKITFTGVKQVSVGDLRGKLAVQQSSWFPLAPKQYLETPFTVEVDRDRIEAYYRAHGYYAAHVVSARTKPYKDGKAVDIFFTVSEGEPTRVRKLEVQGLEELGTAHDLGLEKLPLKTGNVFDHDQYLLSKELLLRSLRDHGYAFAKVSGEADVDRDHRTADVTIVAQTGPEVRLGQAHVKGTQQISIPAIEKHAAVPSGQLYKPLLLETIQDKLYSLGVFSTVKVEPKARPDNPAIADVDITVGDGKLRELRVGGGFGIEPQRNEVHLGLAFTQRRFLGGLRTLALVFQPGYAVMPALWETDSASRRHGPIFDLKADFTQPDLLGPNSALTASLIYSLGLEYAYQYHGPGARIGVQRTFWQNRIKLAASYGFQFLQFFNPVITDGNGDQSSGSLIGYTSPYRLGYLQEQAVLDLRNRALDATNGFFLGIVSEQGGDYTGSAFSYQKILPEARAYVSVGANDRVTFAARVLFGQMWTQGDNGSPITQRLYLGGPGSHRGFSYNRLSYQVCTGSSSSNPDLITVLPFCPVTSTAQSAYSNFRRIPIGGDQMVLGQFETRVRLFRLAGNWLSLVGFVDAGDVVAPTQACTPPATLSQGARPEPTNLPKTPEGCIKVPYPTALDLARLHIAVGGGLRYRTVIGTIRFDLGVRLNHLAPVENGIENPDPGQQFQPQISIGEAF